MPPTPGPRFSIITLFSTPGGLREAAGAALKWPQRKPPETHCSPRNTGVRAAVPHLGASARGEVSARLPCACASARKTPPGPGPDVACAAPLHHVLDRKAQRDPEGPAAKEGRWREARRLSRRSAGTRRDAARDLPPGSVPGAEGPVTAPLAPARLSPPPAPPRRAPARPLAARSPAPCCRHHFRTAPP